MSRGDDDGQDRAGESPTQAVTWTIGSSTVTSLLDAVGPFFAPREDAFPTATPGQWREADRLDPWALGVDGRWHIHFRCFAIRSAAAGIVLVDAGVGPADSPVASWAPVPGRLPDSLAEAGIDPTQVNTVVLTHFHVDHIGWAVVSDSSGTRPYFPNARYILQRRELRSLRVSNPNVCLRVIEPIEDRGQLSTIEGEARLAPDLRVVATPGHTPGHQSLLLESDGSRMAIAGDVLVHALQLTDPEIEYAFESDADQARASRRAILDFLRGSGGVLATAHLSQPLIALP